MPHKDTVACDCGHAHHDDGCDCGHAHHDDGCDCGHAHGNDGCDCGHAHGNDGCDCGHAHGVRPETNEIIATGIKITCALSLLALGWLLAQVGVPQPALRWVRLALHLVAYFLAGYEVLWTAVKNIAHGKIFDENFLMTVATVGAFAIGDSAEAVAVMVFYGVGEMLQNLAVARSRENIGALMDIRPEFARVVRGGELQEVSPGQVETGEIILIQPGERVPLDCTVQSGEAAVDASALTGESMPVAAAPGVALASGSVNLNGVLTCMVTSVFAQSTVQKIMALVSDASSKKARAEKFITRFSKIYTPCVMAAALLIAVVPPLLLTGTDTFSEWFYRGLIFLVVSCPCALVISIPVSFLGGIGGAAKNGVLVKGGDVIDVLAAPKVLIVDKTGTLTKGEFAVRHVVCAPNVEENTLLAAAALCERNSKHPIALSVRRYCGEQDSGAKITAYEERVGCGVVADTEEGVYAAGNDKLMAALRVQMPNAAKAATQAASAGTVLRVARGTQYLGMLLITDEIKPDTKAAIAALRGLGVERCYMLTGDNEATAAAVAEAAGLDGYRAGLLPHEKVAAYEALAAETQGVCVYAGDGINDAPLLARADVGVAMGGVGSDAAIEAADVVLMTDELTKLAQAIRVARKTHGIVKQNIAFALGVKGVVLLLAAFGYTPMWLAIFADVGVALLAIANAARAIRLRG